MEKNIEIVVKHIITNEELDTAGINYADLGIKIQMIDAEEIYITKKGILIHTKDKYLTTTDLKEYIRKNEYQNKKCIKNYFDTFTP